MKPVTPPQTGGRSAGSITAAMFLKSVAQCAEAKDGQEPAMKWVHIDIAGSTEVRSPWFFWLRPTLSSYLGHKIVTVSGARDDGSTSSVSYSAFV